MFLNHGSKKFLNQEIFTHLQTFFDYCHHKINFKNKNAQEKQKYVFSWSAKVSKNNLCNFSHKIRYLFTL